ncbi:MAG: hypothetical protein H7263_08480 [Candidatus Sericytochromatia bacterium]|nr:hypothetical protein [Candidatus Sericytochromatia bacterium]
MLEKTKERSKKIFRNFDPLDKKLFFRALYLSINIRIALFIVAYFVGRAIPKYYTPVSELIFQVAYKWDARSFLYLSQYGYTNIGDERNFLAYFPLYPAMVNIFHYLTVTYMASALFVSFIASVFAGYFLQKLVLIDSDEEQANKSLWFFYLFPTAYFLTQPYTESLFIALIISSVFYARKSVWSVACILGMFACATRLQGLVILPTIMIEFYLQKEKKISSLAWLGIIPLGFVSYLLINFYVAGNAFEFLKIQREHFFHQNIFPTQQIWNTITTIFKDPTSEMKTLLQEARLLAVIFSFIILGISYKWMRISYQFYAWCQLIILLTDSWLMSLPRYLLPLFPIYIVLAKLSKKQEVYQTMIMISTIIMSGLFSLYVAGNWAF